MGDTDGFEVTGFFVGAIVGLVVGDEVGFAVGEAVGFKVDSIGLVDGTYVG